MRFWAILAGVLAVGCGGSEEAREPSGGDETQLEEPCTLLFTESYNYCEDNCVWRTKVGADGRGGVSVADSRSAPETKRSFTLTQEELGTLKAVLDESLAQPWEPLYGCPDCYDQGSYTLGYTACGDTASRETQVDPKFPPEHLKPLIARMRQLSQAHAP